ncbi:MAG: hypothetical protein MUE51_08910 [Thermoleophilia bacterium]|jgi:hypothetical protein|nr:hypothetical protein [Thermoleophilia bacterium]
MRTTPLLVAASALAIGAGAMLGTGGPSDAEAASTFRVTPEQLKINQRISQAAVRRSNEALGLLGPVRPANSTDQNPVNPFPASLRGKGWPGSALADGAVGTPKIADAAVTTPKIANDSVTNDKLTPATRAVVANVTRLPVTRVGNGQTAELYRLGPVTLTARCRVNVGGLDIAEVLIATTTDGVAFDGNDDSANLTAATPEDQRQFVLGQAVTGTGFFEQEQDGSVLAPDGTNFTSQIWAGMNLQGRPAGECSFGGLITAG